MPWFTYILLGLYGVACLILIGVVLLQSGKGDIASAFGGGGAQNAFGPRGAANTLQKVTMGAAIGFMLLAFVFTLPGVLGGGSVAYDIDDAPAATQPAQPAQPAQQPAPAPTTPAPAPQQPAVTPAPQGEQKPAEQPKPAQQPPAQQPANK